MKRTPAENGAVLAELLCAIPIAAMVLLAALSMFSILHTGFERIFIDSEQQYSARALLEEITRDVKQTSSLEVRNGGGVLCLKESEGGEIRYYLDRSQVNRSSGGTSIPITEYTRSISFSEINTATVRMDITFEKNGRLFSLSGICTRNH